MLCGLKLATKGAGGDWVAGIDIPWWPCWHSSGWSPPNLAYQPKSEFFSRLARLCANNKNSSSDTVRVEMQEIRNCDGWLVGRNIFRDEVQMIMRDPADLASL